MAITKEKKKDIVSSLKKVAEGSKSLVFVTFKGLPVKDASELRRTLKKENVAYSVTKKTLLKKVFSESDIKGDMPDLPGELALAYLSVEASSSNGDIIAPAKGIYDFQKKLEGKVSIMGGVFDGEYKSKEETLSIASIPSLHVLRGMFVNIINSPVQRFAIALGQIASK